MGFLNSETLVIKTVYKENHMPATWNCGPSGPKTVEELRKVLKDKIKSKTGKALIADKFTKDHLFSGHQGDVLKLGQQLAKLRDLPHSTIILSSMTQSANKEVLNWIDKVPADKLTYAKNTWTISTLSSTVKMVDTYKFATVDLFALKRMNSDDIKKKSRNWLTESMKTPKLACQFDLLGVPQIYHLDY